MASESGGGPTYRPILLVIGVLMAAYLACAGFGWPQHGAEMAAAVAETTADQHAPLSEPPLWMIAPFALLLAAIALLPLIPRTSHWWEHNRNKLLVALLLAGASLAYYLVLHESPVKLHWPGESVVAHNPAGLNFAATLAVTANALLYEYLPFIVLLFSLYTISGGIRLQGDLAAHSLTNAGFLAVGAVLASLVGTTGAAMLLIRPLLETNRERKQVAHTIVFFIFIVCNCGGCLLPTGDPPLFLGYLLGVPFLFTLRLWPQWLFVNGMLLAIYFVWDHFFCYPRESRGDIARDEADVTPLRVLGLWPNGILLVLVIATVGLLDPGKMLLGTDWRPWLYLREIVQLGLVAISLLASSVVVRRRNNFNFAAIVEVAALFLGIFVCMQPPLEILHARGPSLGLTEPWQYFWASGGLSSFLDNAPTYVVFFETARSVTAQGGESFAPTVAGVFVKFLVAVSLGSVFMGANTYIGNGPNFMVKSIAESSGVEMPSFFGYMAYSVTILIPLFVLTTFLFL